MSLIKPPEPNGYALFGPEPKFPDVPYTEWKARIDKARKLMQENNVDLLMLWSMQNCRYFTGFTSIHWHVPSIHPLVALIPIEGDPVVITGEFFRWTVEAQTWIRDIRGQADVHQVKSERELPKEVAETVKEMGYGNKNIGLEMGHHGHMWIPRPLNDIRTLMNELPEAKFVDGDKVIWGCRMIKSPLEIDRMTAAVAIHRQAMATVVEQYRPGMTEKDVGKLFLCSAYEKGADWVLSGHIMCGPDKEGMFDTGYHFDGVTINKGDYLSIDMILNYKGYWADNGRIINVGPPPENHKKKYEVACKSFDAGVEAAKPGVKTKEVWEAVNKVLLEGGCGSIEMYGHGVGMDVHEPPIFGFADETVLQPGMTFELEVGVLTGFRALGGDGLVHYENTIIITDRGCNVIDGLRRDIIEVSYAFE